MAGTKSWIESVAFSTRFIVLCCALIASRTHAQPVPLKRIPTGELYITSPGVVVIRDSMEWARFWLRFEQWSRADSGIVHAMVPPVAFRQSMLVAVAYHGFSGCSNSASYIRRVDERSDSLVVVVGPRITRGGITCMAIVYPVDVVQIARSTKPVAFHSDDTQLAAPPPAVWLTQPTMPTFDGMTPDVRRSMVLPLVRDPATPLTTIRTFASRGLLAEGGVNDYLMRRADARSDWKILELVSGAGGGELAREADSLLFAQFGPAVARDSSTPQHILANLVESFKKNWTPHKAVLAAAMLQNERVIRDRWLLGYLRFAVGAQPEVVREVCRVLLAHHRPSDDFYDPRGYLYRGADNGFDCPQQPPPARD